MQQSRKKRLSSGVPGLDEILEGGFLPGRAYMVRGGPGSGKTTLGMHFLEAASEAGERALYITLGETEAQLRENADSVGIGLGGVEFLDLSPSSDFFAELQTYDVFSPAEVERVPIAQKILEQVGEGGPRRVFLDSMTQFRYLSPDAYQFRKQVLSFLRYLTDRGATVLFTSENSSGAPDDDLQFMSDGVLLLRSGASGRSLCVTKLRGSGFRSGLHSLKLSERGMEVFPRLVPGELRREIEFEALPFGIPNLDELLHGGLERGTVTIFSGPTGVGKTTLGLQFMKEAAGRGERSVVYAFEEAVPILLHRCESIRIPVRSMIERGTLAIVPIEPLRYSADELVSMVRQEVEQQGARIVMLDSVSGYRLAVRGEDVVRSLHALCTYLKNMGTTVLLVDEVHSIGGGLRATDVGMSYLADNIVYLRYMEARTPEGTELRKTIGVLKKRASDFEQSPRELKITPYGLQVGGPMQGIATSIVNSAPVQVRPDAEEAG
jgi:circadian clock protein KaiC